ncbi:HEAT repeat domain-containing protein [Schlesneria paludicola]|uniref:HEAT repeat domain-containing protein n=1 Tax=Schlesneria paludicola TaxID=360056 RepID=UPI00029A193D|nr:HEAT repeat domain-containing protein [Schlesneria paludicola]
MAKVRNWIGVVSAPILLISAGCSVAPRPFSSAHRRHAPERLISIAQAYERQGQLAQAQEIYQRVLAVQPGNNHAQQSLDALMARQNPSHQSAAEQVSAPPRELLADTGLLLSSIPTRPVLVEPELAPLPPVLPAPAPMTSGAAQLQELARQDANSKLATATAPEPPSPEPVPSSVPELSTTPSMVQVAVRVEHDPQDIPPSPTAALDAPAPQVILEPPADLEPIAIPPLDTAIARIEPPVSPPATSPPAIASSPIPAIETGIPVLPLAAPEAPKVIDASHHEASSKQMSSEPAAEPAHDRHPANEENLEFVLPRIAASPATLPVDAVLPRNHGWISTATQTAPLIHDASPDSTPFFEPLMAAGEIANLELKPFFGPFHVQLIAKLRAHREKLQGQLVGLVTNDFTSAEMRSRAVFLLGSIGPEARDAVPAMQQELQRNHDVFFEIIVAEAILKIDHENQAAIEQLVGCLSSTDTNVRWVATFALRNASSPYRTMVVDHLRTLLVTDDPKVQRMVLLTLAEFGPSAAAARPEIEATLQSVDSETRVIARACLDRVDRDQ